MSEVPMSSDRETTLRDAVIAFLAKWPDAKKAIDSVCLIAHVHGAGYSGPTLGVEIEAMQAALASTLPASVPVEPSACGESAHGSQDTLGGDVMYPSEREEFQWAMNDRNALHAKEIAAKDAEVHSLRTALNRAFDDLVTLRREIAALTLKRHDRDCELRGPGGAVERRCSCGFRALRAELATLRGQLAEAGAVCACGCPDAEHEDYGEDGQACGVEGHECHRVSRSALTTPQVLREQLAAAQQHADELRQYALLMNAHDGRIVSAGADAISAALSSPSTQEHATVCEWRPYEFRNGNYYALVGTCCEVAEEMPVLRRAVKKWKCCPYCTLPLKLSPESPNEGAK